VVGSGRKERHLYIPSNSKKTSATPKIDALLKEMHLGCSDEELAIVRNQYSPEEAIDLAKKSGLDDKAVKEIRDEIKKLVKEH